MNLTKMPLKSLLPLLVRHALLLGIAFVTVAPSARGQMLGSSQGSEESESSRVGYASWNELQEGQEPPLSLVPPSNDPLEPLNNAPLSLSILENMALNNNPTLVQAWAGVQRAEGQFIQEGYRLNPIMAYEGEDMGAAGTAGLQGASISQRMQLGNKRFLDQQVAYHEYIATQHEHAAQEMRVIGDVRQAYYRVLLAQDRVELSVELGSLSEAALTAIEALVEAEQVRPFDMVQQRLQVQTDQIDLVEAVARSQGAWRSLAAVVGRPDLTPTKLLGGVEENLPHLEWETSRERIWLENPQFAVASARLDKARWAVDRACAGRIPDVDFQVAVQHDNTSGDTLTSLSVGLPLQLFDRNGGNILSAQADLRAAQAEFDRLSLVMQEELAKVFADYDAAREEVKRYREDILPNAREAMNMVTEGYPEQFSYLERLTTERLYYQAHRSYLDALERLRDSAVLIDSLLLSNSLSVELP